MSADKLSCKSLPIADKFLIVVKDGDRWRGFYFLCVNISVLRGFKEFGNVKIHQGIEKCLNFLVMLFF